MVRFIVFDVGPAIRFVLSTEPEVNQVHFLSVCLAYAKVLQLDVAVHIAQIVQFLYPI